jgi:hypothetical protein
MCFEPRWFAHQTSSEIFLMAVFQNMYSMAPWFQNGAETLGDGPLAITSPIWS